MRILAIALIALSLSGCTAARIVTASVDNPVTTEKMYQVEQGAVVIAAGLNAYRDLCIQKVIDQKCRKAIVEIQAYTIPLRRQLVTLRAYFKANDKLNAINAYNVLTQLLADARKAAVKNGIVVQ